MVFYDRTSRDRIKAQARQFRKKTETAEYILRAHIKRSGERKVLRQHVVGRCIVDLGLPFRNLLIEVDGDSHENTKERDFRRDKWFEQLGFNVLRVTNEDVMKNHEGIIEAIKSYPASDKNKVQFYIATRAAKKRSYWVEKEEKPKDSEGFQRPQSKYVPSGDKQAALWDLYPVSTQIH